MVPIIIDTVFAVGINRVHVITVHADKIIDGPFIL